MLFRRYSPPIAGRVLNQFSRQYSINRILFQETPVEGMRSLRPRSIFARTLNSATSDAPLEIQTRPVSEIELKAEYDQRTKEELVVAYTRNIQNSMTSTLQQLVQQNQTARNWFRNNSRYNGTMGVNEHHEKITPGVGIVYIHAGRNNTHVTLTDWNHKMITAVSGGMCGLSGHHRGTPESGTRSATRLARAALAKGFRDVFVVFKGFGPGRDSAFRSLMASGLSIRRISDKTPIQHGGCKPRKARRV